MDQPVKMPCRLLDRFTHLIIAVQVENIRNEVERVLVILDFGVEASQVEAIGQVVLINLAEVFVAS
jgi:hypothetical protein